MDITHPHDSFIRFVLSKEKRTIDLFRYHIPSNVAQHLLFDTLTAETDTFVDSQLKHHYSDALFKLQTQSGTPAYVYFLLDHKSAPDPEISLQLQRYMNRIWTRFTANHPGQNLPPIIGIVLYHGIRPWNMGTEFKSRFDCPEEFFPFIPDFRYLLIDLSTISDDQFQGGADLKAALLLMKYIFHPNLRDYLPMILRILKEARHLPDFYPFFEAFMLYLLQYVDQNDHREIEKLIHYEFPEEGDHIMPSVADKLRQEGRQEGWQEGLQEGRQEGLHEGQGKGQLLVITRLLQRKFGALDPAMVEQLQQLSNDQVEELVDTFFEFQTLNDFKMWLHEKLS